MEFYSDPFKLYIQMSLGTECFTTLSFYNISLPETPCHSSDTAHALSPVPAAMAPLSASVSYFFWVFMCVGSDSVAFLYLAT